jgi:hypothetical protein
MMTEAITESLLAPRARSVYRAFRV